MPISRTKTLTTQTLDGFITRYCRKCRALSQVHICVDADCWWPDGWCQTCMRLVYKTSVVFMGEAHA